MFPYEFEACDDKAKSKWGNGPWQDEADSLEWRDTETEYECALIRHSLFGHFCGYVRIPDGHLLGGKTYRDRAPIPKGWMERQVNVDQDVGVMNLFCAQIMMDDETAELSLLLFCHGGLTYGNKGWIGFDCGHSGDLSPGCLSSVKGNVYRDLPYVKAQVTRLAKQIWDYQYAMTASVEK